MTLLNIEVATKSTEEKLGELYWELFKTTETEVRSKKVTSAIDDLVSHLCASNRIDRSKIKIHILQKGEINAFAMPDHHLVIFTGLIEACENEAELAGVIAHEIAHMEKNHVMKSLIKEVGLSVIISITTGGRSTEMIKETAKVLTSSAYDRHLESEADLCAADYLLSADLDPEGLATFLFKLANEEKNIPSQFYWISSHPESEQRAADIIEYIKSKDVAKDSVLTSLQWNDMKKRLQDID